MAVFQDGQTLRTIGGGAVERIAARQATELFQTGASYCQAFCLAPNQVNDIGMICGGSVTVYFRFFDHENARDLELIKTILSFWRAGRTRGSSAGWRTGKLPRWERSTRRTGCALPSWTKRCSARGSQAARSTARRAVLLRRTHQPAGRVYVFGGGHVGKALVPVLANVGFRVAVFDNRKDFAKPENYPQPSR